MACFITIVVIDKIGRKAVLMMGSAVMATGIGLAATYNVYAVCAVISVFLVQRFIVEPKGKELEEMQGLG